MVAVLEAFFVIGVVIAVGAVVGRTGVLGDNARMVLNRVAFHVGVPALLLLSLAEASPAQVFSLPLLVSALAALIVFGTSFAVARLRRRSVGDATIAGWTACYANAGNLGIPLSVYVFGGAAQVSALILFQVVVLAPIGVALLSADAGAATSVRRSLTALATTPIIVASAVGLVIAAVGVQVPPLLADPIGLLADLAIPTVLIAFGISLTSRTEALPRADRVDVGIVVTLKTVAMPLLAYAVARWVFHADPDELMLVTVLAALPSAQNINTYAAVYRRGESLARDATLVSTVVSVPVIVVVVTLLG